MEDTADVTRKRVLTAARTALEPTPHGVRLRQRFAALIGLVLGVLGFLAAVGLGQLVALTLLALLALLAAAGGVGEEREEGEEGEGDELWRKRLTATRREPASNPRREAARLNARGADLRRSGDPEGAIAAHMDALELVRKL